MKKILLSMAMLLTAAVFANAAEPAFTMSQDNETAESTESAKSEKSPLFFIQVGGGVNCACDNFRQETSKWLIGCTPAVDLIFGVNPVDGFGLRLGYQGFTAKRESEKFAYNYAHLDFVWNITDMKCVKSKHFIAKPYVETGLAIANSTTSGGLGAGVVLGYRINRSFDIVLDARATYLYNGSTPVPGKYNCGNGSATINLVYNF